jgi:hypothetical protein
MILFTRFKFGTIAVEPHDKILGLQGIGVNGWRLDKVALQKQNSLSRATGRNLASMYDCKAIRPPPIREVVVAPSGRATWLEARDVLLTVAGQRRTFTGFAFKPLIREGWHPKGLFNCPDCICG